MKTLMLIVLAAIAISSCARVSVILGPIGKPAYVIRCGSAAAHVCYEKAGELCPQGWLIADKQESGAAIAAPIGSTTFAARGPNTMLVECK